MARYLHVVAAIDGTKSEADIPLPENWEEMTPARQAGWSDETLAFHVANTVESWHEVH